jgi:ubiquinone/menaquinone biosynthesis C-methylase UbiE
MPGKPPAAGKSSFDLIDKKRFFSQLDLPPNSTLIDLACGVGNYSIEISKISGAEYKIYAIDLWAEGIQELNALIKDQGITNIQTIVADISRKIPLETASADACLLATTLHDLSQEAQDSTMREVHRVLKPEGIFIIIEFKKIDKGPGPPISIRLSEDEVDKFVVKYGFAKIATVLIFILNGFRKFMENSNE